MRLLLSNDDGIDAPGLRALADGLADLADIAIVAPANEQSASSHALTMHKPLRVDRRSEAEWAVGGTPADCVYMALHGLLDSTPDRVISGINWGSNLGSDVHYSGTVAAAREAVLQGCQAIAVSLANPRGRKTAHMETAVAVVRRVLAGLEEHPVSARTLFNINVPNRPLSELKGLRACHLGERVYDPMVDERIDPRGRTYVWIGGPHSHFDGDDFADGQALKQGWATITPLLIDITQHDQLTGLRNWTD